MAGGYVMNVWIEGGWWLIRVGEAAPAGSSGSGCGEGACRYSC